MSNYSEINDKQINILKELKNNKHNKDYIIELLT